jgi:hypothetical protein
LQEREKENRQEVSTTRRRGTTSRVTRYVLCERAQVRTEGGGRRAPLPYACDRRLCRQHPQQEHQQQEKEEEEEEEEEREEAL